jgi:hypothetical protein
MAKSGVATETATDIADRLQAEAAEKMRVVAEARAALWDRIQADEPELARLITALSLKFGRLEAVEVDWPDDT